MVKTYSIIVVLCFVAYTNVQAQIDQTITFSPLTDKTYKDAAFSLTATSTSGLAVTYVSSDPTVASINGNLVTIIKAGTTNITTSQSGDASYNAAVDVIQPLVINKADQPIDSRYIIDNTYGETYRRPRRHRRSLCSKLPTFISSNTEVATIDSRTGWITIVNAGVTTITISIEGTENCNAASFSKTITIHKASAAITLGNLNQVYDGTPKSVTAITTATGISTFNLTYNGSQTVPVLAGTYAVSASINNTNYEANTTGSLVIASVQVTKNGELSINNLSYVNKFGATGTGTAVSANGELLIVND